MADGEIIYAWHNLQADALHDGFQIRFRQQSGDNVDNDYWHIDDVAIYDGSGIETFSPTITTIIDYSDDPTGIAGTMSSGTPATPVMEIITPVEESITIVVEPQTVIPVVEEPVEPTMEASEEPAESPEIVDAIDDTVEASSTDNLVIANTDKASEFPVWIIFVTISMLAIVGYFYKRRK